MKLNILSISDRRMKQWRSWVQFSFCFVYLFTDSLFGSYSQSPLPLPSSYFSML